MQTVLLLMIILFDSCLLACRSQYSECLILLTHISRDPVWLFLCRQLECRNMLYEICLLIRELAKVKANKNQIGRRPFLDV